MRDEGVVIARREWQRAAAGFLGVAVLFWLPALLRLRHTGFGDWQMVHHNWEVGYVALRRFGEWPLWDPFHCGGITMWGNPESQHLSPFFFLSFVTGTTVAIKVMVVVHTWAGLLGMYVLGRRHFDLEPLGAAYAAVLWGCSGFFAWQIGGGHGTFISFYLAPWVLLAWRATLADWRWAAALAALLALAIFQGGTYPFPYFVLLLAFDAVVQLARGTGAGRISRAAIVGGAWTLLLSAPRWIPVLITLDRVPRNVGEADALSPWEIPAMLLRWRFPWRHPDHPFVWPEYSAYIGIAGTALVLGGIYLGVRARRYGLLAGAVVFGAFMMGSFADWAPWSLVHRLPVYDSLRVPSRFSVLFLFYLAPLAGLALQKLVERVMVSSTASRLWRDRPKIAQLLPAVLLLAAVAEPVVHGMSVNARWRRAPITTSAAGDGFHLIPALHYHYVYASLPRRHQGTPACYVGNLDWPISDALWLGEQPQARVLRGNGTVHAWGRTVNRVWAEATLEEEGHLVFNQNHDPDWHTHAGEMVSDLDRLAVALPPGRHRVELHYDPAHLRLSLGLGALGAALVLLSGGWLFFQRRTKVTAPREE